MSLTEIIVLSIPLAVVLLSLAFMPLIAPKFWHKNEGAVFAIVSAISIVALYSLLPEANHILKDALIDDYIPFIIMLFTLYALSHGIHIKLRASSNTLSNVVFLACCSLFSSVIGTTGASMLYLVIFFIFLVSNIGGLLTPLGDPPLLLGYLHGIDFFWELRNLFPYWLSYLVVCLVILYVVDKIILRKDKTELASERRKVSITIGGYLNIGLIIATVFVLAFEINIYQKDVLLLSFCGLSFYRNRQIGEKIDYAPFFEVARTFLVIFIVLAPVLFILNNHSDSIHKYILSISNGKDGAMVYFWLCSLASSFLDNAPSYLLFFNMAGGNPEELMYVYPNILTAISISSVVMGSMTYIGNAPNMMVKSIATRKGIAMPSFLGYVLWSVAIILPLSYIVAHLL